jgi:L-amino acid N-acyltransferase YncA
MTGMRHATEADLAAIVAIYNSTVPTRQSTADTQGVSVESRREWFRQHTPNRRPLLVHEIQNRIVAWVSFQSFRGRPAYDYTAEISIHIAPQYRGQGLGKQLLAEAIAMTPVLGIKTLVGFVFSHNEPSIRLLRSCGFDEWGKLPDIAEMDGKEYSVSILGKRINPAGENQNRRHISAGQARPEHVLKGANAPKRVISK